MTKMVDVTDKFVCKVRWKSPATGVLESVGVLDVYYVGPLPKNIRQCYSERLTL